MIMLKSEEIDYQKILQGIDEIYTIEDSIDVFQAQRKNKKPEFNVVYGYYDGDDLYLTFETLTGYKVDIEDIQKKYARICQNEGIVLGKMLLMISVTESYNLDGTSNHFGEAVFVVQDGQDDTETLYDVYREKVRKDIAKQLYNKLVSHVK